MINPDRFKVEILDWPSRFLVEDEAIKTTPEFEFDDRDQEKTEPRVFLVDLEDRECDCAGFEKFKTCEHIEVAKSFKAYFSEKPKTLRPPASR